ncbi:hypothetical protein [Streptomyces sp. NBC_00094]|uniref:hypothetical protein n=1 Tax=Streptomyces sp. NBC_00094 TaxID=2903620 RepID=UPI002255A599|nr:hypothetical protein [Streptomyces sp. NBC_00094]MCX5394358.1 hypothetical protein [Streptomyces sp. NBC_00094]
MRNRVHKRWLVPVVAAALAGAMAAGTPTASAGGTAPTAGHGPTQAPTAPSLVQGPGSDCFWYYGGIGADPLFNIAYPDAGAVYWAAYYRRPAGSKLTLEGTYPHARYFSFISYDRLGQPVDGIADYQIAPNEGSANPFAPGARRNTPATKRGYTVSFDHTANYDAATGKPAFTIRDPRNDEPQRNALRTIPTASLGQTPLGVETGSDGVRYETDLVLMRVYVPDRGKDLTGGVGLPRPTLTLADGKKLTGQAACDATDSESKDHARLDKGATRLPEPSSLTLSEATYSALRYPDRIPDSADMLPNTPGVQVQVFPPTGPKTPASYASPPPGVLFQTKRAVDPAFPATYSPGAGHGTSRTTRWTAQYDRSYLLQTWTGDDTVGANPTPGRTGGGFFPNIHNNYVRTVLSGKLGQVAVIKGKLPTAVSTRDHDPVMGSAQVRYASFCVNESVYTTRVMDCAYDEEVPVDKNGDYTIVVSLDQDRPQNARTACGVAYLARTARGDGYQDQDFAWFQIRNMLPDTGFHQAVQNTKVPGDEATAMGSHLPNVTYMSTDRFEAKGCARR